MSPQVMSTFVLFIVTYLLWFWSKTYASQRPLIQINSNPQSIDVVSFLNARDYRNTYLLMLALMGNLEILIIHITGRLASSFSTGNDTNSFFMRPVPLPCV